jgi:hypothetical protein
LFTAASSFFSNPIFRSGEDCRQFNFNSYPGISVKHTRGGLRSYVLPDWRRCRRYVHGRFSDRREEQPERSVAALGVRLKCFPAFGACGRPSSSLRAATRRCRSDRLAGIVDRRAAIQLSRSGLGVADLTGVNVLVFGRFLLGAVVSRTVQSHPTAKIQPPTTSVGQCTPR